MAICKKDYRQESSFSLQAKEWIYLQTFDPQEVLQKGFLQNINLVLDLLCHKHNSLIMTKYNIYDYT